MGAEQRPQRTWARALRAALSTTLLVVLLAFVLPTVTGSDWRSTMATLSLVTRWEMVGLTALWLVGLWAYTFVMAASLRGLRKSQALALQFAGSAVSNLLPAGGAVGVAVTWSMLRRYGHSHSAIGLFTVVTGLWHNLARLALPAAGLGALLLAGSHVDESVRTAAIFGIITTLAVIGLVVAALLHDGAAQWLISVITRASLWLTRLLRRPAPRDLPSVLEDLRRSARELLRRGRVPLVGGMTAYVVLQGVLFWGCLAAVGNDLGWAQVTAAYATGRMLTLVILTPGGAGFAETGTAAVLVALGGDPTATMAGVLLFSFFTFALEIPGGALAYLWHLRQTRPGRAWSTEPVAAG